MLVVCCLTPLNNVVRKNQIKTSKIQEFRLADRDRLGLAVLGFGQDAHGEIYVLGNETGVPFGIGPGFDIPTGVLMRIAPATGSSSDFQESRNFRTHLNGRQQPTPVDTRAQGQAIFQLSKDGTELKFKVIVAKIDNVIGAHIHLAPAGQNGPIVLPLLGNPFIPDPGVTVNGILVEGTATAADVSGPLAGDLDALIAAMRTGDTYVNVPTVEFRPGEIRGQIR